MTDPIDDLIARLRTEADTADFTHLTVGAVAAGSHRSPWARLRTRAAALTASIAIVLGGLGGVAYAADGAAPGDLLYGVDRALESIGIGNGGDAERLTEIQTLMDDGDIGRGLQHAAANLVDDLDARSALNEAAERISTATEAPEGVPTLLTYLSENIDAVDGRVVADLAHQIAGHPAAPDTPGATPGGPPEGTPNGPPEGVPGNPPDERPAGPPQGVPGGPPGVVPPTTTP